MSEEEHPSVDVSLGGRDVPRRPPWLLHVLLFVVALLLVVLRPEIALAAYLFLYALSGPVITAVLRVSKRSGPASLAEQQELPDDEPDDHSADPMLPAQDRMNSLPTRRN